MCPKLSGSQTDPKAWNPRGWRLTYCLFFTNREVDYLKKTKKTNELIHVYVDNP